MTIKDLFADVETTGTDPKIHAIHQLAFGIYIDGVEKELIDLKMRPFDGAVIDQRALDLKGLTIEQIMAYPDPREAYNTMVSIMGKYVNKFDKMDKYHFYAYNAHFDNQFIREYFIRMGDNYFGSWFYSNPIDIMTLAGEKFKAIRHQMPNFQLMTVASCVDGITIDPAMAHDGKYDIQISKQLYDKLTS